MCVCRQQDLYRVLKAYTLHRPEEGYCQAQAPIAAVLLMHMPAEVSPRIPSLYMQKMLNTLVTHTRGMWHTPQPC